MRWEWGVGRRGGRKLTRHLKYFKTYASLFPQALKNGTHLQLEKNEVFRIYGNGCLTLSFNSYFN